MAGWHHRLNGHGFGWCVTHQAPLSVGFSRQEYWSGFPCLYFHIYCMSGTGDRDRISILKKPQLTEFLIWAGPLEQSGFLNRN